MTRTYRRPVVAPKCCTVHGRRPCWAKAYVGPGGPISFAPGCYLHLPYGGGDWLQEDEVQVRVFFPLPYEGRTVRLARDEEGKWWWEWETAK